MSHVFLILARQTFLQGTILNNSKLINFGHPARVAIIEYLLKVDTCICGDIVNVLPLAQPTVSQHLKELKNAGLVKGNIEGTAICYCIDKKGIEKSKKYFTTLSAQLTQKENDCC